MKIAVLFPGIGYTCDKPLLYYAGRLARELDYEVLPVPYGSFPQGAKGDDDKMRACLDSACRQAEERLAGVDWAKYDDRLFIGKSIGTVVAARYARAHALRVRYALLTPLEATFPDLQGEAVAFHGTADPWAETGRIAAACAARGIPLRLTEGANHSLETGCVETDLATLHRTMQTLRAFIESRAASAAPARP